MLQSRNYPPSPDLAPYVRNHFVFRAPLPDGFVLIDQLLSETAMIRVILKGDWSARFDGEGEWRSTGPSILFGPNTRCFSVRVQGAFVVAGCAIRPSGWPALVEQPADQFTDKMVPLDAAWVGVGDLLYQRIVAVENDDLAVVAALEHTLREQITAPPRRKIDGSMAALERIALNDSTTPVASAAAELGLSMPTLKRRSCATFGLTPKSVLRRSRFLDMATAKRGISDPSETERLALRFADQSHLNREFRHFVGMTPKEFDRTPTPLLDAVLSLRHERGVQSLP